MKSVFLCLLMAAGIQGLLAQRIIEKTFKTSKEQPVLIDFDFPKIKISSWARDEIYIKATVNINDNKQNELFELRSKTSNGQLVISDTIDFKNIRQYYYVETNGIKKRFETKADFESYKQQYKTGRSYSSNNMEIEIEVFLPVKEAIKVKSKFGLVEVQDYKGPLTVHTEFGKLDVKLREANVGKIKLTNQFGKIYTDFNLKPVEKLERAFYTSVTATPGAGPGYDLSSKFGNIYLRNAK